MLNCITTKIHKNYYLKKKKFKYTISPPIQKKEVNSLVQNRVNGNKVTKKKVYERVLFMKKKQFLLITQKYFISEKFSLAKKAKNSI